MVGQVDGIHKPGGFLGFVCAIDGNGKRMRVRPGAGCASAQAEVTRRNLVKGNLRPTIELGKKAKIRVHGWGSLAALASCSKTVARRQLGKVTATVWSAIRWIEWHSSSAL